MIPINSDLVQDPSTSQRKTYTFKISEKDNFFPFSLIFKMLIPFLPNLKQQPSSCCRRLYTSYDIVFVIWFDKLTPNIQRYEKIFPLSLWFSLRFYLRPNTEVIETTNIMVFISFRHSDCGAMAETNPVPLLMFCRLLWLSLHPDLVKCLRCRTVMVPLDGHQIEKGEMTPLATSFQSTTSCCLSHQD